MFVERNRDPESIDLSYFDYGPYPTTLSQSSVKRKRGRKREREKGSYRLWLEISKNCSARTDAKNDSFSQTLNLHLV